MIFQHLTPLAMNCEKTRMKWGDKLKKTWRNIRNCQCFFAENRFSYLIFSIFTMTLFYLFYEIQYKTGIEIVPFLPIDDSGFEIYNEDRLKQVYTSNAANQQPKSGGLLCWAMTTSIYHKTRVPAIAETWLKRCDAGHIFTNSGRFLNESVPYHTVFKGLPESYYKLFWKTRLALLYVYKYVSKDFDWYFKGDDDTYLIVDNLKRYISTLDPNKPYFIGYRLSRRTKTGYNAGGSGYLMSRETMRLFSEKLFNDKNACPYHEWEDFAIAKCLRSVEIYPLDSRDELGRQRFLPWRPEEHFYADLTKSFQMDPVKIWGPAIYHENLISLHHLQPNEIRLIDGILYFVSQGVWMKRDENSSNPNPHNQTKSTSTTTTTTTTTTTQTTSMDDTLPPPTVHKNS